VIVEDERGDALELTEQAVESKSWTGHDDPNLVWPVGYPEIILPAMPTTKLPASPSPNA
jgi:hypothetical protein